MLPLVIFVMSLKRQILLVVLISHFLNYFLLFSYKMDFIFFLIFSKIPIAAKIVIVEDPP